MKNNIWLFKFNLALFQIVLILAKLMDLVSFSWWWALSPILAIHGLAFAIGFARGFAGDKARDTKND